MKNFFYSILVLLSINLCSIVAHASSNEESFEDLQKFQKEMEQTVQKIQKMVLGTGKSTGAGAPSDSQLEHWRIKFFHLLNDQKFVDAINKIWNHPQRNYMLYTQLGLFIFMIFFKAWRKSAASNWLSSLWVSFYCFVLFWGLSLFLIPLVMLGQAYQDVLSALWKTISF